MEIWLRILAEWASLWCCCCVLLCSIWGILTYGAYLHRDLLTWLSLRLMDRLYTEARNQTRLAVFIMDTYRLGEELLAWCKGEESKFADIQELLGSLAENQRREVLRYRDQVSESSAYCVWWHSIYIWCFYEKLIIQCMHIRYDCVRVVNKAEDSHWHTLEWRNSITWGGWDE